MVLSVIKHLWEWEITRAGDDERLTMNEGKGGWEEG